MILLKVGERERIHDHVKGRVFKDCIARHQRVCLQFEDGYEVEVDWDSSGPELRTATQTLVLSNERAMPTQFAYVVGKTVRQVVTDGARLYLCFTDGHELVFRWEREPDARAVNVTINPLPSVAIFGDANT